MADAWETFPAQMGEHLAYISFNKSYAEIAEKDPRTYLFQVRLQFKRPTPRGMPTGEEFPDVSRVEDLLDAAVVSGGGLEVGRLTVKGHRTFYFYVPFQEQKAKEIVASVSGQTTYQLQYSVELDQAKGGFWKELYPSVDDWQVIGDLRVLDSLRTQGDVAEAPREVSHWAYFPAQSQARQFADWANLNFYAVNSVESTDDKKKVVVRFTHKGNMELADITRHTIAINRKARELGGNYDGWETSVERRR
ncbi:DUF695 domain-containing protein [Roseateles sp. P5_D6]